MGTIAAPLATPSSYAVAPPLVVGPSALPTSERHVLGESVTHRCVELIADGIAGAAWGEWRDDEPLEPSRLTRRPAANLTRRDWTWRVAATLALYSWCPLVRTGGTDSEGVIRSLVPVLPGDVHRDEQGWTFRGERVPAGVRVVRRATWPALDSDVASVIVLAREVFAAALAAASYDAAFWDAGGAPRTIISTEQPLSVQQANELRELYVAQRREHPGEPAVFGRGAGLTAFGADAASEGATASAGRVGAAVARYFGIPPHMANVPNYASTMLYQNAETAGIDFVRYTLGAYAGAIGDALSEELPGSAETGRQVRLSLAYLMRGEQESRFRGWQMALGQWMTREEIREIEGLPAVPLAGAFDEAPAAAPLDSGASTPPQLELVEGAA